MLNMKITKRSSRLSRTCSKKISRLSTNLERQIQSVPNVAWGLGTTILMVIALFWLDKENSFSSWHLSSLKDFFSESIKILVGNAETIAIAVAAFLYCKDAPDRKDRKHYEAWQIIDNATQGREEDGSTKYTSYALFKALQDLNKDRISLKKLHIPGANLDDIDLRFSRLSEANLRGASLKQARLQGSRLEEAKMQDACLSEAQLQKADLYCANLTNARLDGAWLENADLTGVWLEGVNLSFAHLEGTTLSSITWNPETIWPDKSEVEKAKNVPYELKKQLGIEGFETDA